MTDRQERAEAARRKILASGNPDLINQLHLMEAAQVSQTPPGRAAQGGPGPGTFVLGGVALAGGAWLGAWLGASLAALALDDEMQEAFAVLAEDLGLAESTDLADSAGAAGPEPEAGGDLFDDLGGFFDI